MQSPTNIVRLDVSKPAPVTLEGADLVRHNETAKVDQAIAEWTGAVRRFFNADIVDVEYLPRL
ncbi:MAG: hypothetical protein AAGF58_14670 [Pseudomonadota bacterium]